MATDAMRPQAVPRHRPANPASDRIFFAAMAAVLWATVLYGFAKTYFLAGMVAAPLPNKLIHIHGAAFTLWMVLLVVQIGFVYAGKIAWHKRLGFFGFGLAVAMLILGPLAATDALRRGSAPLGLTPQTFYVIPLSDMLVFGVLVFFAYRARRRSAAHKRLILIATIGLMDAAVGRWPVAFFQHYPKLQDLVPLAFLLAVMAYDLISLRRIQKATLWASLFVIVVHLTRVPIGLSQPWQRFANHMAAKG
jgi:FtsH-binding integral membrane protein